MTENATYISEWQVSADAPGAIVLPQDARGGADRFRVTLLPNGDLVLSPVKQSHPFLRGEEGRKPEERALILEDDWQTAPPHVQRRAQTAKSNGPAAIGRNEDLGWYIMSRGVNSTYIAWSEKKKNIRQYAVRWIDFHFDRKSWRFSITKRTKQLRFKQRSDGPFGWCTPLDNEIEFATRYLQREGYVEIASQPGEPATYRLSDRFLQSAE